MANFIGASKRITDIRDFLREASGGNSIKYNPVKGGKHQIYVPFQQVTYIDEDGNKQTKNAPIAISGEIHEWKGLDGKFNAVHCMKDFMRKGEDGSPLNDGSCPFCDRVSDAYDIYNYRMELEKSSCNLSGDALDKHMEKVAATCREEMKARKPRYYLYVLIALFKFDNAGKPVMDDDGDPQYDMKVMRLSGYRMEKMEQQLNNSGSQFVGSEIIFEYPSTDDPRLLVSQSTTAPVFPTNMMTAKYPRLVEKINQDCSKFEWDGIEKSFGEWKAMSSFEAANIMTKMFEKWDEYRKNLEVDPNARYMEYVSSVPTSQPQLSGLGAPMIPGMTGDMSAGAATQGANGPGVVLPGMATQGVTLPGVTSANGVTPVGAEKPGVPDLNSVFGGNNGGIQI